MRRRRLGEPADRQKVKALLKENNPGWKQTRLTALKMGFNSENSNAFIAESLGVSEASVKRWFAAFRAGGIEAALDRKYGIGRPTGLNEEIEAYLITGLENARWNTAAQARDELEKHFKRRFKYHRVWHWLKKCAGVLRVPRPVHEKRDSAKAEAFKRNFLGILRRLPVTRKKPVKIWFADESRYGLLPNHRRVWTLKGLRPHKLWQSKYDWSYCYGAIDPVEGKTVFVQTPSVSMEWTQAFLEQIKTQYPDHEHIVVWDGAGFHPKDSSHEMIPEGIHIVTLPPYSPELNPIEKLWDLIQDHTANKLWPTIERLDTVVGLHLKDWWEEPLKVISLFGKGWIRASANAT
jgi:transposase